MNFKLKKGFTLVELLIVIGLLGAIALIVISTINPIEQSNRARDTRFKADGSQLVSAIDRYFVGKNEFPWTTLTPATTSEMAFGFVSAKTIDVGVCGDSSCSTDGNLLASNELKSEFKNRDFIKDTSSTTSKKIFIGKAATSASSIYACFVPLSESVRDKACTDGKVYTVSSAGIRTSVSASTCAGAWITTGDTSAWMVCIPE